MKTQEAKKPTDMATKGKGADKPKVGDAKGKTGSSKMAPPFLKKGKK